MTGAEASDQLFDAARSRCERALSRLDGALMWRFANPTDVERPSATPGRRAAKDVQAAPYVLSCELFGFMRVAASLRTGLARYGFDGVDLRFDAWLAQSGPPPERFPHHAHTVEEISGAILVDLGVDRWPVVSGAATFVKSAAPQLMIGPVAGEQQEPPDAAIRRGRLLFEEAPGPGKGLDALVSTINAAAAAGWGTRPHGSDETPLQTPTETRLFKPRTSASDTWALEQNMRVAIRHFGQVSVEVPLPGSISVAGLRTDISQAERRRALLDALAAAAEEALVDLRRAYKICADAYQSLARLRANSKAPRAFVAIAGLGGLRPSQIARGLDVTPLGAAGIVKTLVGLGLVRVDADGVVRAGRQGDPAERGASPALPELAAVAQVDDAAEALEALLARYGSAPAADWED